MLLVVWLQAQKGYIDCVGHYASVGQVSEDWKPFERLMYMSQDFFEQSTLIGAGLAIRRFGRQLAFDGLVVGGIIVRVATARGLVLGIELDILLLAVFVQLSSTATRGRQSSPRR